jgi:hypothetical protein
LCIVQEFTCHQKMSNLHVAYQRQTSKGFFQLKYFFIIDFYSHKSK